MEPGKRDVSDITTGEGTPPSVGTAKAVALVSPRWIGCVLLVGFLLGLVVMSAWGHRVARRDYHPDFTRFYPRISPEGFYYPTVQEMCSIVRARCRPDQVLVIVGGNSIFFGVSQPPGEVWTERLQQDLGPKFCVINFAFRGASPSDGGAVIAETLRDEFPHQIYIANEAPLKPMPVCGSETYGFIFWEAYDKGWLEDYAPRRDFIRHVLPKDYPKLLPPRWQLYALDKLDRALAYRDFWNWVSFDHFFTLPMPPEEKFPEAFAARKKVGDTEFDGRQLTFAQRFRPQTWDAEMAIVRAFTSIPYARAPDGGWRLLEAVREDFLRFSRTAMSEKSRKRTLMVVSKNSPFFVRKMDADEQRRDALGIADTIALWREAGYHAMTYPDNLDETDFHDRTHLLAPGGKKLADAVAPVVQAMATELGYQTSR